VLLGQYLAPPLIVSLIYAIDFGTTTSLLGAAIPAARAGLDPARPGALDPTILKKRECLFPTARAVTTEARPFARLRATTGRKAADRSIKRFLPVRSFRRNLRR